MSLFKFLPGHRDCQGIIHVKRADGNGMMEIRCKLQHGHDGNHLGYANKRLLPFKAESDYPSRWHNASSHRDELSKRFDNPNAKSATGVNGRTYFVLGPGNSLTRKK